MVSALEKQVYIYSIGTESFYTDKEHEIHKKLVRLYILRGKLDKAIKKKKDNRNTRKERLIKTKKILIKSYIIIKKNLLHFLMILKV